MVTRRMAELKLIVRKIIAGGDNGKSQVVVHSDVFKATKGVVPALPYKGIGDETGNGVRMFTIDGINLYSHYNKETSKTSFAMDTKDAKKCLLTLEQERAGEDKLDFSFERLLSSSQELK